MTRVYYKDAHACIVMFDLTQRLTFQNAVKWKKDLDAKCTLQDGSPVPCLLLANKVRISKMSRLVGKPTICIGENKGADQLRSNCKADQRLFFRYSDSTIPLLLKSEISSF